MLFFQEFFKILPVAGALLQKTDFLHE
jgi:hypothetical protein